MAGTLTLAPKPLNTGLGMGFWVDLQAQLTIVIGVLEANTAADTGSSTAGEKAFDPNENTVTDLVNAITTVIGTYKVTD